MELARRIGIKEKTRRTLHCRNLQPSKGNGRHDRPKLLKRAKQSSVQGAGEEPGEGPGDGVKNATVPR